MFLSYILHVLIMQILTKAKRQKGKRFDRFATLKAISWRSNSLQRSSQALALAENKTP